MLKNKTWASLYPPAGFSCEWPSLGKTLQSPSLELIEPRLYIDMWAVTMIYMYLKENILKAAKNTIQAIISSVG